MCIADVRFPVVKGYKSSTIVEFLRDEGLSVSVSSVCRLLRKYRKTGSVDRLPGSGRPSKITPEVSKVVEDTMLLDDETTDTQLQKILVERVTHYV